MSFSTFNSIQSFIVYCQRSVLSYIYNFPSLDPSLVLFYPLDISATVGTTKTTANYGSIVSNLPTYDASFVGNIVTDPSFVITGVGDLSLNNTMGGTATNYVIANNSFTLNPTGGLTISCWFSTTGELGKIGTLISLAPPPTTTPFSFDSSLSMYFPFNTNVTDTITSTNTSATYTINTSNNIVGTGCLDLITPETFPVISADFTNSFNSTSTSYTISFWLYIKTRITSGDRMYWFVGLNNNTKGFFPTVFPSISTSNIGINLNGGLNNNTTINTIIPDMPLNTWKHSTLVFTNNGNNLTIYVDGSLYNSHSGLPKLFNNSITYNKLSFGTQSSSDYNAPCLLDDFRVYNRALTQSEITTLYYYNNKPSGLEIDICGNSIYSGYYNSIINNSFSLSSSPLSSLTSTYSASGNDKGNIVISGTSGIIYSSNFGKTFTASTGTTGAIFCVSINNNGIGLACSISTLYSSSDYGKTWTTAGRSSTLVPTGWYFSQVQVTQTGKSYVFTRYTNNPFSSHTATTGFYHSTDNFSTNSTSWSRPTYTTGSDYFSCTSTGDCMQCYTYDGLSGFYNGITGGTGWNNNATNYNIFNSTGVKCKAIGISDNGIYVVGICNNNTIKYTTITTINNLNLGTIGSINSGITTTGVSFCSVDNNGNCFFSTESGFYKFTWYTKTVSLIASATTGGFNYSFGCSPSGNYCYYYIASDKYYFKQF